MTTTETILKMLRMTRDQEGLGNVQPYNWARTFGRTTAEMDELIVQVRKEGRE